MPIRFPPVTMGPVALYREQLWLANGFKAFDVVPAPNLGQVGVIFSGMPSATGTQTILNPGLPRPKGNTFAVNLRRLATVYEAPTSTSVVNPAKQIINDHIDEYAGYNRVLGYSNNRITGVSRDATGAALGGCTVNVFQTFNNVLVGSTVSDGSGNWTVYPDQAGPYYFVEYKAGSPDVFGTSPNTNTATQFSPGQ
jgi:hypothetical protein